MQSNAPRCCKFIEVRRYDAGVHKTDASDRYGGILVQTSRSFRVQQDWNESCDQWLDPLRKLRVIYVKKV